MAEMHGRIAVIPARGGSKRVPRKNVRSFFGHPMLAYSIAAAQNSGLFDEIIVSTEDHEIGATALFYGARYLERPRELANDTAGSGVVGVHALRTLMAEGKRPAEVCLLLPTCPLRTARDIHQHYLAFREGARPAQISVVPFLGVYPHWAVVQDETGRGRFFFKGSGELNSQELKQAHCPTGAIWWIRAEVLDRMETFYAPDYAIELMDPVRGFDIDTEEDWAHAELLVYGLKARDGKFPLEQPLPMSLKQEVIPR